MIFRLRCATLMLLVPFVACKDSGGGGLPFQTVGRQPDIAPVMLNNELPFRYPPALYAQRVQGNVTLRIYINGDGDRKSTRLNSSHLVISYAVFCLKKKKYPPQTTSH